MDKIYLTALGGSGENARNSYMMEMSDGNLLLDCGVKREIINGQVGIYPDLNSEIVSGIKAVLLSHCHEDHVAALPLLYQLGYQGKVYGSKETIKEARGFVKKWMNYVKNCHGILPFEEEMADRIEFEAIEDFADKNSIAKEDGFKGKNYQIPEFPHIKIRIGRSGHVLGGIWYHFTIGDKKILYTGDMCRDHSTLAWDCPEECDAAIMNAAYAGMKMDQSAQYDKLLDAVKKCVEHGGKAMLPVPPKGRGIDITIFLAEKLPEMKLFVEEVVIKSMKELAGKREWMKPGVLETLPENLTVIRSEEERRNALAYQGGAVYLAPDGMISTELSLSYFHALKNEAGNCFVISGHAATGTAGAGVLDDDYRLEHGVRASGIKVVFKVHMDDDDVQFLCEKVGLKQVILFHSDAPKTERIKNILKAEGINAVTLQYPERLGV